MYPKGSAIFVYVKKEASELLPTLFTSCSRIVEFFTFFFSSPQARKIDHYNSRPLPNLNPIFENPLK
jgi:hypothetical protein